MSKKAASDSGGSPEEQVGVDEPSQGLPNGADVEAEVGSEAVGAVGAEPGAIPDVDLEASSETIEEELAEVDVSTDLTSLQTELEELKDRHLRLVADFSNYRRRQEVEMTEAWGRAQADLVRRFLDVLDDLERVAVLDPADEAVTVEVIVEGIDLVERKFLRALEEAGVDILNPMGEPFDPEVMEAMMRAPAESEEDDDRVAGVFAKGYRLKKHLIRPARVSVFKAD